MSSEQHLFTEDPFDVVNSNSHHLIALLPAPSTHPITCCLACYTPCAHPLLTLTFCFLLVDYFTHPSLRLEWHLYRWANWAITGTILYWLWTVFEISHWDCCLHQPTQDVGHFQSFKTLH
jgi:hypothetical protein